MSMKKLIYIFAVALAVAGCRKMQDDLFSESSSQRVQKLMDAAFATLTSDDAGDGWYFEYYPGWDANMEKGGYWYWCRFNKNRTVDAAIELDLTYGKDDDNIPVEYAGGELVISSPFDIVRGRGAVLSFNIKNEILDLFTEPSSGLPTGYQGDTDFSIVSVAPDRVVVKGIKTNKLMYFYRKTDKAAIADVFEDMLDATEFLYPRLVKATVAGAASATLARTERHLALTYTADGKTSTVEMPSVPTLDGRGIHLSSPVKVMGVEITGFRVDEQTGRLVSDDAAKTVSIGLPDVLNEYATSISLALQKDAASMSPDFIAAWDAAQTSVTASEGETIWGASFGAGSVTTAQKKTDDPSLHFEVGAPGKQIWHVYFIMEITATAGSTDQIAVKYTAQGLNGNYSSYTVAMEPMAKLIEAKSPYTLTTDDPKTPSWIRYTSSADASFFFTTYL